MSETTTSPLYAVADFCRKSSRDLTAHRIELNADSLFLTWKACSHSDGHTHDIGRRIHYGIGYGTNLEGSFPTVCKAIELCHEAVHRLGAQRIATDIRIGTRTDKPAPALDGQTENQRKKQSVVQRLAQD
ncbi:hypothetical protein PHSY_005205 [Pseudozyma hubeiensis SY62]|uniref:Thiamine-binding protein domain-containing protein n=1 Tax=Pseudozyma hubeiensis (strain SY62) TaxID=1305764 RepID=R9P8E4_PSEHS|nr:hypothetical protein PHSY_005205 [Pseudozyma hubeiensis SY62]GAC97619.1 hypothetical protein PHSY_005205 [Pseudozyma hubeiensis SY62]